MEKTILGKLTNSEHVLPGPSFWSRMVMCPYLGALVVWGSLAVSLAPHGLLGAVPSSLQDESAAGQRKDRIQAREPEAELTGHEIAALKKEELDLAENLVRDYPDLGQSFVVLANVWHRHGNAVEALKYWREALKKTPNRADVYESMGWLSIKKGAFAEAIELYRKALAIQPQMRDVYSNIGHALMILGRHSEAIVALNREIQISPQPVFSYFLLGQIYLQQKDYKKASDNYEMAVRINPTYTNAYFGLATVCAKLGDRARAQAFSGRFKQLKAEDRKVLKGRKSRYDDLIKTHQRAALTYREVGRVYYADGKLQPAQKLLERAVDLDAENSACLMELATLYQKSGDLARALSTYQKAVQWEPRNAMGFFQIGILCARLKQMDAAEAALHQVIRLAPGQAAAYRELALMYFTRGTNLSEARTLAEKAVALQESASHYYVLSLICKRSGDPAGTLAAIQQALRLEPDNTRYQRFYEQSLLKN